MTFDDEFRVGRVFPTVALLTETANRLAILEGNKLSREGCALKCRRAWGRKAPKNPKPSPAGPIEKKKRSRTEHIVLVGCTFRIAWTIAQTQAHAESGAPPYPPAAVRVTGGSRLKHIPACKPIYDLVVGIPMTARPGLVGLAAPPMRRPPVVLEAQETPGPMQGEMGKSRMGTSAVVDLTSDAPTIAPPACVGRVGRSSLVIDVDDESVASSLNLATRRSAAPRREVAVWPAEAQNQGPVDVDRLDFEDRDGPKFEVRVKESRSVVSKIGKDIQEWFRGEPGIIYCMTRKDCEAVAVELSEKHDVAARPFHMGLTQKVRTENKVAWSSGACRVICTTTFRVGIEKVDVRFVYHHSLPKSFEGQAKLVVFFWPPIEFYF